RDFTIATIAAPTVETAPSEEDEGEATEAGGEADEDEAESE
ncbi:MAG TPA: 50S ribosomal protein L25, partial [Alphaproteobacteria bacterium]|nr:50S ribosomal protein L25 [Alphaproteobacteria bacterium]HCO91733.1 50S ribosomal protein L25 [Alphaproteobacteria bacterium]